MRTRADFPAILKERLPLSEPTVIVVTGSREWGSIRVLQEVAQHLKENQSNVIALFHGGKGYIEGWLDQWLRGCCNVYEVFGDREMLEAAQRLAARNKATVRVLAFPTQTCIEAARAMSIPISVFSQHPFEPGPTEILPEPNEHHASSNLGQVDGCQLPPDFWA